MRRGLAIGLAGLCLLASLAGSPVHATARQAEGTVGIRLVDAPSSRADDPRARLYVVDHLAPGTTINRRIEVDNGTNERQFIELYAASASVENAEFRFGEGRAANELTSWTRIVPTDMTLEPGEAATATVTIAVPSAASEGERYGVVWAELRAVPTAQEGIGAVNRVGVRMYLSVGAGGEPPTDFEITDIEGRRDGNRNPTVAAIVRNIGGRAVDLNGELNLTDGPGGLSAGPVGAEGGTTITPGQSGPVLFVLDPALPAGPWQAKVTMRSGATIRDATGTVTFPEQPGAVGEGGLSEERSVLLPAAGAVVGALLIGWFFFWFVWRRKKKDEEEEPAPAG